MSEKELIVNLKFGEYGPEGEVWFGLFDRYIRLVLDEHNNLFYANLCAQALNSFTEPMIDELCEALLRYREEVYEMTGREVEEMKEPREVLQLVTPGILIVNEPPEGDLVAIHLECECEWEPEHGVEIVIRHDQLMYVGSFTGQDPFGNCDIGEDWNFVKVAK